MITKRQSVFETNSSSSHSLTIGCGKNWDTINLDQDNNIILEGGEFGWGYEEYYDALTKANYYAVDNRGYEENLELLTKVLKEYTNCNEVIFNFDLDSYYDSYIDHQSSGLTREEIYTEDDLKNFIFNRSSILIIDNDNH